MTPAAAEPLLRGQGWAGAAVAPLTHDASPRRYWRLTRASAETCILMSDPEGTAPQVARMAALLAARGIDAPRILAADPPFALVSDLGADRLAEVAANPATEIEGYRTAGALLAQVQTVPPPDDLALADAAHLTDLVTPYLHHCAPPRPEAIMPALQETLSRHLEDAPVLVLRDFHAENLTWRAARAGLDRLGCLDVQDGLRGPALYDLASLLADARRDVGPEAAEAARRAYLDATGRAGTDADAAMAVLTVQRNLRILGLFARFARTGNTNYQRFVPRVTGHIARALTHPACRALAQALPERLS